MTPARELRIMRHVIRFKPDTDTPELLVKLNTTKRELDNFRRRLEEDEPGFMKVYEDKEAQYKARASKARTAAQKTREINKAEKEAGPEVDEAVVKVTEIYQNILDRFNVKWDKSQKDSA